MAINKVILTGRTTKDVEVRYSGDMAVARFTLAVDRKSKDKETDFISCIAFRKTAEVIEKYVSKGQKIGVCGKIQTGSYEGKDGKKVYTTDVIVDEVDFLESKSSAPSQQTPQQTPPRNTAPPSFEQASMAGFMQVDPMSDEGLPFN